MSYTTPTLSLIGQASNVVLGPKLKVATELVINRGYQGSMAYSFSSLDGEW